MEIRDLLSNSEGEENQQKKESPLKSLEADLKLYSESMREVATEILTEGISSYPIFIAHQHDVNVGEIILDRHELNTEWTIQASTLEEFIEKGLILSDKKDHFIRKYKAPHQFMCLFVIVPEGANFVFYPYQD